MHTPHSSPSSSPAPRKRVNLTIPQNLIEEARALDLNLSSEAEAGIAAAIKKAREAQWLQENAEAIIAYNAWYEERGPLFPPIWEER